MRNEKKSSDLELNGSDLELNGSRNLTAGRKIQTVLNGTVIRIRNVFLRLTFSKNGPLWKIPFYAFFLLKKRIRF